MRTVAKATRSDAFSEAEKGTTGAKDSVQAMSTEGLQRLEQASANFQRSLAYKELMGHSKEVAASIEQDLTTRIMNRLAHERATIDGHHYNGFEKRDVDALMRNNNPEMRALVERLANEETEAMLREKFGNLKTPEDVRAFFNSGKDALPTAGDIAAHGRNWRGQVQGAAARAGVDPHALVVDSRNLKGQVDGRLSAGQAAVAQAQNGIEQGGKPIEQGVKDKTDQPPSFLGMTGNSLANAAAGGLPSGTVWGADKVLGKIGEWTGGAVNLQPNASFWRQDADNYKGDEWTAAAETLALFGGGVAGKFVGKGVGGLIGRIPGAKAAEQVVKDAGQTIAQNNPGLTSIVAGEAKQEVVDAVARIGARAGVPVGMMVGGEIADRTGAGAMLGPRVEGALDQAVAAGEGVARETFGLPPQTQQPSGPGANAGALDGAWNQGEKAAGDLFSGSPGGSNLGSLLGGGQRPMPPQPQPVEGTQGQQKGDAPPPSGR